MGDCFECLQCGDDGCLPCENERLKKQLCKLKNSLEDQIKFWQERYLSSQQNGAQQERIFLSLEKKANDRIKELERALEASEALHGKAAAAE